MKFRHKVVIYMMCILALLYGIGSGVMINMSFGKNLKREQEVAIQNYKILLGTLQLFGANEDLITVNDIVKTVEEFEKQNKNTFNTICIKYGNDIIYSIGDGVDDIAVDANGIDSSHFRVSNVNIDSGKFIKTDGVFNVNDMDFSICTTYDISGIYNQRNDDIKRYKYLFVVMLAIGALMSYIATLILTRKISILVRTSKKIADGDVTARTKIKSNDEIGLLAKEFDTMAENVEINLQKLEDDMERQNQFIGNFTHELKTPMTSIIGYADLIRSESLSKDEEIEAANYVYTEAKRLERMSLKLLDLFVMDNNAINLSNSNPGQIIENVVDIQRAKYKEYGIEIDCSCEEGSCMMEPDLISSLLVNLIDNARKAIDDKGQITIEQRFDQGNCEIKVTDNGKGMPEEALEHITEAYYRVDKARSREKGGAGLGLAICKKIIELHNGTIKFDSEIGKGTTVTVRL